MKLKFHFISVFLILFFNFTVIPAQALKFADFAISDSFITVGESFDVEVSVFDDGTLGDLTGFGFDVDPFGLLSNLSFDGFAIGPDFLDASLVSNRVEGLYLGPFEDPPGSGDLVGNAGTDVLLATLTFTALSVGIDTLEIAGLFDFDPSVGLFYEGLPIFEAENFEGMVDITINPVPEPATILLLVSGMAGMGVFGRKKFRKK